MADGQGRADSWSSGCGAALPVTPSATAPSVPQFPLTAGSPGLCGWGQHPSFPQPTGLELQKHPRGPAVTLFRLRDWLTEPVLGGLQDVMSMSHGMLRARGLRLPPRYLTVSPSRVCVRLGTVRCSPGHRPRLLCCLSDIKGMAVSALLGAPVPTRLAPGSASACMSVSTRRGQAAEPPCLCGTSRQQFSRCCHRCPPALRDLGDRAAFQGLFQRCLMSLGSPRQRVPHSVASQLRRHLLVAFPLGGTWCVDQDPVPLGLPGPGRTSV